MITEKQRASNRKYRETHREEIKERKRLDRLNNIEKFRERDLKRWHENKEHYTKLNKIWREKNKSKLNERRANLRLETLEHYSGGRPECLCCGEKMLGFLCIDHVNGGGTKHRKEINGSSIYQWLKTNKYPEGFAVLCHNCNLAKAFYGKCPHNE